MDAGGIEILWFRAVWTAVDSRGRRLEIYGSEGWGSSPSGRAAVTIEGCCKSLHIGWEQMSVAVHRDRDRRVTKVHLYRLGMRSLCYEKGRAGVSQIMCAESFGGPASATALYQTWRRKLEFRNGLPSGEVETSASTTGGTPLAGS